MTHKSMMTHVGNPASSFLVRPAKHDDLGGIVEVHSAAFPGFFLTDMGKPFLRTYYRVVLRYDCGILQVAEEDGSISGFISGFLDPVCFYRFMSANKWRFVLPMFLGFVRKPWLLRRILGNSKRVVQPKAPDGCLSEVTCELSSIGVRPEMSGQGLGGQLVRGFVTSAASQNAACVFLTTDAKNNEDVNAFYKRLGFQLERILTETGNRPKNEYVLRTSIRAPENEMDVAQ
jgi:ribosomal protein S18 acetylase RimI-like enzyme